MISMTQTTCDFSLLGGFRRLLSYGVRELHLSLSALICFGGGDSYGAFPTFRLHKARQVTRYANDHTKLHTHRKEDNRHSHHT